MAKNHRLIRRTAAEVVMNTMTNGASQNSSELPASPGHGGHVRSERRVRMVALGSVRNQYLDGGYGLDCARRLPAVMDKEVKILLDKCYRDAVALIPKNLEDMHEVMPTVWRRRPSPAARWWPSSRAGTPPCVEEAYASCSRSAGLCPGTSSLPPGISTSSARRSRLPIPLEEPEPAESEETPAEDSRTAGAEHSAPASEEPVRNEGMQSTEEDPSDTKPKRKCTSALCGTEWSRRGGLSLGRFR